MTNRKRTRHHLSCELISVGGVGSAASAVLMGLVTPFRPMVSEPINSSLFHQLAEQLQQQNMEQFQKQLLEHQQHQQKVGRFSVHAAVSHSDAGGGLLQGKILR